MVFLNYAACSTCKKAKRWLDDNHISYIDRQIKADNPSFDELSDWYARSGLPLKRFFNTSGVQYRSLNLKETLPAMSEHEQLELLASDGMLIRRPLLIDESYLLVGFHPAQWAEVLLP